MKRLLRHLAVLAALVALLLSGGAAAHVDAAAAAPAEVSAAQMHAPHDAPASHQGAAAAQECAPFAIHCGGAGAILAQSTVDRLFRSAVRLRLNLPAQALARGLPAEAETPPPRA